LFVCLGKLCVLSGKQQPCVAAALALCERSRRLVKNILQAKKVACWSKYVTHLKLVSADKHAIKNLDRELAFVLEDYSAAAGLEAVIPPKCAAETPTASFPHKAHSV
jgi:hypothetical protein